MKTTMLKLSTMAMTLLAIGVEVNSPGAEGLRQGQGWNLLPTAPKDSIAQTSSAIAPNRSPSPSATYSTPFSTVPPAAAPPVAVPSAFDLVIIPGRSMGPVTAETSYSELSKIFEPAHLSESQVSIGNGITKAGTRVNLGETRSFTIIWANEKRTRVAEVRDIGSDWRTPEGIRPGISLEELEAILGPFQLSDFDWDYGGTVRLEGTTLDSYESQLIVRLQPAPEDTRQKEAMKQVLGDELVDSDHESFDELHPVVDEIIVSLAKPRAFCGLGFW